jgi:DNA (cytosine-5)-methyltransferase 1
MKPHNLIVDNFAGGGGASTGIERALGRKIDIAINHDADAVAMHIANHPNTKHFCQSIMSIDPREACTVDGVVCKVLLAWFSPDCKHHSKAKGGKPREKNIRDLATIVPFWPERLKAEKPDVIMLENVEEFRKWGPLDDEGKPIKGREGEEFDFWLRQLRRLGYKIEYRELLACDYGTPQSRNRLYLIARSDGKPIEWPEPTRRPADPVAFERWLKRQHKAGFKIPHPERLLPYRTAAECIDWSIPCPSIFDRKRDLKPNTLRRVAAGTMRYVVNAAEPFIVPVTHSGDARSHGGSEPLRTITTANGGEFAAVDAELAPFFTRTAHGEQDSSGKKRGRGSHGADEPMPTSTQSRDSALTEVVLAPHVTKFRGGAIGSSAKDPLPTVTANGEPARPAGSQPLGVVSATLITTGHGERPGQEPRARSIEAPTAATTATGSQGALVTAFLSAAYTSNTNGGRGKPTLPLKTIMSGGKHHGVVCAHMEQANTGMVGHDMRTPFSTVVGKGCTQRVVETTLLEEGDLSPDVMAKATRVAAFLVKYFGTAQGADLNEPMDTVTTLPRFAVVTVTIDATTYVIIDIGLRMLTPRELARAMGLPESYKLNPVVSKFDKRGRKMTRPLTISEQISKIGNMVCPDVAEALVGANLPKQGLEAERMVA